MYYIRTIRGPRLKFHQYTILSGSKAYTRSLIKMVHQSLFPPSYFAHSYGMGLHNEGGSRMSISGIGWHFAQIRSPFLVHPGQLLCVTCDVTQGHSESIFGRISSFGSNLCSDYHSLCPNLCHTLAFLVY